MGWPKESRRHGLASKGIPTARSRKYQVSGTQQKPKLKIGLPSYTHEQIRYISHISNGKEWIAEIKMVNGNLFIDDIQISKKIDKSFLHWTYGDESNNVGYIHLHPKGIMPEFSAEDFILAFTIHEKRENKKNYPYTIMGVVYPENDKLIIKLYAVKPKAETIKQFELYRGTKFIERDIQDKLDKMEENKELIKLHEISGIVA